MGHSEQAQASEHASSVRAHSSASCNGVEQSHAVSNHRAYRAASLLPRKQARKAMVAAKRWYTGKCSGSTSASSVSNAVPSHPHRAADPPYCTPLGPALTRCRPGPADCAGAVRVNGYIGTSEGSSDQPPRRTCSLKFLATSPLGSSSRSRGVAGNAAWMRDTSSLYGTCARGTVRQAGAAATSAAARQRGSFTAACGTLHEPGGSGGQVIGAMAGPTAAMPSAMPSLGAGFKKKLAAKLPK